MDGDSEKKNQPATTTTQNTSYPVQDTIASQSSSRNASSESNSNSTKSKSNLNNRPSNSASSSKNQQNIQNDEINQESNSLSNDEQQSTRTASSDTTKTETSSATDDGGGGWGFSGGWGGAWGGVADLAKSVGAAVVQGVKEELQEIKEDITMVADASLEASKKVAEVSQTVAERAVEHSQAAATASKDFIQNDLKEFNRVLGEETHETMKDVNVVGSMAVDTIGGWASHLSTAVANTGGMLIGNWEDDEISTQGIIIGKGKHKINFVTAYEARIHSLRTDTTTYCSEPVDSADYDLWKETFGIDTPNTKKTISDLLVNSQEVRSLYTKLVPSAVAHQEFWQRYFYKLDALERAERKRTALMERAERSGTEEEDDLSWGDDNDSENGETGKLDVTPTPTPMDDLTNVDVQENVDEKSVIKSIDSLKVDGKNNPSSNNSESPVMVQSVNNKDEESTTSKKSAAQQVLESDDWEKEFDIDMTEEEIAKALNNDAGDGEEENLDDWD